VLSRIQVIAEKFPAAMSIPGNPDEHMTLITTSGKCIVLFFISNDCAHVKVIELLVKWP